MANITGPQPEIKYCPICKGDVRDLRRIEMQSSRYVRADGTASLYTHTYECQVCHNCFELNQARK